LAEGVAHVMRDGDRRRRVAEADALLLKGAEEVVVGAVCVGGAGGEQGGQAQRAGDKRGADGGFGESRGAHCVGFLQWWVRFAIEIRIRAEAWRILGKCLATQRGDSVPPLTPTQHRSAHRGIAR
jgi:hypothetical protein